LGKYVQQEIADAVDEAAQIYKEDVPPEEQSGNGLSEVLDAVVKKTTEELGHKFNKQQSIANPALGKDFLEEVISLSLPSEFYIRYCSHSLHFLGIHDKIYFDDICFRLLGIIAPTILRRLR
jgi:hypothetical protein